MMESEDEPPDDYRYLSLFPQPKDLEQFNFLRQNIISGSYRDVRHYLDVQFRLLREDFIDPLRDGINKYKRSLTCPFGMQELRPEFTVHMYKNVKVLNISTSPRNNEISYQIQLDERWASQVQWENSKRLKFGSLVLFTDDNFENFQLGIVVNRELKQLQKGLLNVALVGKDCFGSGLQHSSYLMAESDAFFEPVYQALKAIQNLSLDNLVMERYLLVKDVAPKRPVYLSASTNIMVGNYFVTISRDDTWPSCDQLAMNKAQLEAFKAALRQEFVVIQGPPGTGKTYLGLRIVQTLLSNFKLNSPILMLAYTNHALDQFLEGMLAFTDRLIRIGGQCKTESLMDHNFDRIRSNILSGNKVVNGMGVKWQRPRNRNVRKLRGALKECYSHIVEHTNLINIIESGEGLINVLGWSGELQLAAANQFSHIDDILDWLIDDYAHFKVIMEEFDEDVCSSPNSSVDYDSDEYLDKEDLRRGESFESTEDLLCFSDTSDHEKSVSLSLQSLDDLLKYLENRVLSANLEGASDGEIIELIGDIKIVIDIKSKITQGLCTFSSNAKVDGYKHVNLMALNERWYLYNSWVDEIKQWLLSRVKELRKCYEDTLEELKEIRRNDDLDLLRALKPQILGLTTTGAARLHPLLEQLAPQIIIIEEAAEVLEAYVVASLTSSCQHLILIGDHKQLKPNPSTYELAKHFKLDVSLFERMVNNKVPLNTLNVQHRMKSNIASLLTPTIYETLFSHSSVDEYPPVMGISTNLFFIHHEFHEKKDKLTASRSNLHEASFMISLCTYLLKQGYSSSDITILTTYSSQQYLLTEMSQKVELLEGVRITVVDNYQGEECKIILLSLVRNNQEGQIGYLSTENRICVALSRARHGMYIMGNMNILKAKSNMWNMIDAKLRIQGAIDNSLKLVCQIHGTVTSVKCAKDFKRVEHGGCNLKCSTLLDCGHTCDQLCHPSDPQHSNYKCLQPCNRTLCTKVPPHECTRLCYEECVPCEVVQEARLSLCGHLINVPCHVEPTMAFKCQIQVSITLGCGHQQMGECGEIYTGFDFLCAERCREVLECGHACKKLCHEPCGQCTFKLDETLGCGHVIKVECWEVGQRWKCGRKCQTVLVCGHTCVKKCGERCFCLVCHRKRNRNRSKNR